MTDGVIKDCDHTSVGILVFKDGNLLIIDRKRPPLGLAAPAGHVDKHGGSDDSKDQQYKKAAIEELKEETGLSATSLALIWEGVKKNPCRRPGGNWHYWHIYRAQASGELKPSTEETRGHLWCSRGQMENLLDGKVVTVNGREAGLELVWKEMFNDIGILGMFWG